MDRHPAKHLKILFSLAVTALLTACATERSFDADFSKPIGPTYNEKINVEAAAEEHAKCPSDNSWQKLDWKKVVPIANACVKAMSWFQVEKMGNYMATKGYLAPWGPYYLAVSAEARKDYPRAIWMLELALKKDPKEGLFHYELGRIHWDLKEDADALKEFKQASDLSPGLTAAHAIMGQVALGRQDNSAAETYFQKALAVDSKNLPSLLGMATLKIGAKDYVKAADYLNRVIAVSPQNSKARLALEQIKPLYQAGTNSASIRKPSAAEGKVTQ